MVQNIREAFKENLQEVTWMDDATKQAAAEKVTMVTMVTIDVWEERVSAMFITSQGCLWALCNPLVEVLTILRGLRQGFPDTYVNPKVYHILFRYIGKEKLVRPMRCPQKFVTPRKARHNNKH